MKVVLSSLLFVFTISTGFSQNCIQKYIGFYKINLEETITEIRKTDAAKANEEVPLEIIEMMRGVKLEIKTDALEMTMKGQTNEIKVIPRASKKEGGSCDLLLGVPPEQLPEGAKIPFLTIYQNEKNRLMIKSSLRTNNDIDDYIWTKIE